MVPTENHPVAATYIKQAAKTGMLIVMDPRGMALKRHATHMLQFRPGSDVAMLNAMLNVIVLEGLYDRAYIDAHTEGFENLERHIVQFTPEAMAPICGIDAATLRTVARQYATAKASIIFWGIKDYIAAEFQEWMGFIAVIVILLVLFLPMGVWDKIVKIAERIFKFKIRR